MVFAGVFGIFTYLGPVLLEVTDVSESWMPIVVGAFGMGSVLGNVLGDPVVDRLQFKARGFTLLWTSAVFVAFPFLAKSIASVIIGVNALETIMALVVML